jgi:hypothetical protein
MKSIFAATLIGAAMADSWPHERQVHETGVPPSFDCAMRKLAYSYGKQQIPRQKEFMSLFYALDLNSPTCNVSVPAVEEELPAAVTAATTLAVDAVFVSPTGDDTFVGTADAPLKSIQKAIDLATSTTASKTVYLRGGTHYLADTVNIGPQHSGLQLLGFPGEAATVSGGTELKVSWKKLNADSASDNIYVADVKGQVDDVPGLQIDGARATRARFPNLPGGIETSCGYGCMVPSKSASWTAPDLNKYGPVDFFTDAVPSHDRNDTANAWFEHYMIGVKGLCSVYDPPVSYW